MTFAALVARWRGLSTRRRFLGAAVVATAGVALVVALALQRDTHVALFASPLDATQVAEVGERLAEWNVPFLATADNVRVDGAARSTLLLQLALAGVPHARLDSTAEALAKAGPLTPQAVLEAQERAGLAGDIAAGLRGLAQVADARVIVAPAQPGTFADETGHPATASVRLSLRPGVALDRDVARAIRDYVAAGVPGLDAEHVALLDDRGSTLVDDGRGANGDATALSASLQSALDAAFGPGATIVRTRVAYDARTRELREITRKPLGSRPIATTTSDERFASASKHYGKTNASVDRGSDVEDERIDVPAGRVERISVAIAVDAARRLDLAKIRSLAIGTLGLVSSRGDTLSVEELAFAHTAPSANPVGWAFALGSLAGAVPAILLAAALLLGLRVAATPAATFLERALERAAVARTARVALGYPPDRVRGALRGEPPHTAAAIISALPAATATAVLELYAPEERAAIVRRMARVATPAMPDCDTVLRRG